MIYHMESEEIDEGNTLENNIVKVIYYGRELYDITSGCNMYGDCRLTA